MEIGNQMQNHKIETDSELIYEDGSIWSTLIFIKIIGSDTLLFPLPPSEVLFCPFLDQIMDFYLLHTIYYRILLY